MTKEKDSSPKFFSRILDFPPKTMRGLLRRRYKTINDLVERSNYNQAQIFYLTHKIDIAFQILKCDLERTEEDSINAMRWRGEQI